MVKTKTEVVNKAGLHARAAARLAELCAGFGCDIQIGHEKMVDGKSILSLMMLGATKGTTLNIATEGPEEETALKAIVALIDNRFDEKE